MFVVFRASREMMGVVAEIIRSNAHLYRDIVENEHDWSEHMVDDDWAERNFKIREFYLARDGSGRAAEYVATGSYQNLGDFAYVGYFYVRHGLHGRGYGRALMRFLEARALADGLTDLRLFCNSRSDWAMRFYEKIGFKECTRDKGEIFNIGGGILRPFYEEGSILMKKSVGTR